MKKIVSILGSLFVLELFFVLATQPVWAQADPTKVLIGTWEGQIETAGNSGRTLIINSVKTKGEGEWVARGRYGFSDQVKTGPGGQEMSVLSKENDIFVEFVAGGSKNPVRLKLVGDNRLEGTANMQERGQSRPSDKRIKFEKVASKAGDEK